MKGLRQLEDRVLTAIMVVALMVPLVLVAVSQGSKPTLAFEGARIQVAGDGSVQLLFEVCIKNAPMTTGAQFTLRYDPRYILPSDYTNNEALKNRDSSEKAFYKNPDLYRETVGGQLVAVDPFEKPNNTTIVNYGATTGTIRMILFTNGSIIPSAGSGMTSIEVAEGTAGVNRRNVFDASDKLVLGTLSFRLTDPDLLPELTRKFSGLTNVLLEDNHSRENAADKLIYFEKRATQLGLDPWGIGLCVAGQDHGYEYVTWNDANNDEKAQATFTYEFKKTIIKARAAEAELTLNAYQVYTNGHVGDVDTALQKYSPAITVTYSDGSQGNFIMPWARTANGVDSNGDEIVVDSGGNVISDLPWGVTVVTDQNDTAHPIVVDGTAAAGEISYDPTASRYKVSQSDDQHYLVQKSFCYEEYGEKKIFPVPIDVKLTVTPIILVDVTADDLHKSYILNNDLVDLENPTRIQTIGALELPTQARLVTDVPAGGVTLTMDIPGWSHPQDYTVGGGTVTRYWPSDDTGTDMIDLWRDEAEDTAATDLKTRLSLHWPTADDKGKFAAVAPATEPVRESNGAYLGANRAGMYTFRMASGYGEEPTDFTRAAIQAEYPWLTVPDNDEVPDHPEAWPIDDATRQIVWNEDPEEPDRPKLVDTKYYQVTYVSTVTNSANGQPDLTLQVKRVNGNNIESLMEDSVFRILLPDGTELGTGYTDDAVVLDDWFNGGANGRYQPKENMNVDPNFTGSRRGFDLTANPGDPTTGVYGSEREKLRRYINLGGWFSVAVKEIDDTTGEQTLWSDFIPVYVPPRDNYYEESKVYNFIGENVGLYPWPGGLSTTVILPPGTYEPVTINVGTNTIVPVYTDSTNTVRAVERYGVTTTYDGATGAQPGMLHTFTIDPAPAPSPDNDWRKTGPASVGASDGTTRNVTTYGAEVFRDGAVYNAYGTVLNQMDRNTIPAAYAGSAYTATVRTEELKDDGLVEGIVLEYVSTSGGERSINTSGPNVSAVIYEARTQGYTVRQDYTLRIRNIGNVDINGLSIDTLTDLMGNSAYNKSLDVGGGHFEILKPPASFLPAGESTTFVLTYVYDLRANGSNPVDYRDKLFITSNRKNTTGDGCVAGVDYLLDFDAQFQVTAQDIHRVFVNVVPAGGEMGTAQVIVGLVDDGAGNVTMNTTAGTTAFPQGQTVYVMVSPTDEYTRYEVKAEDSTGGTVYISLYNPPAGITLPDNVEIYIFVMPDYDTTVTVTFTEPVSSKLRLSDLRVYADHNSDNLFDTNKDWNKEDSDNYKAHYQQTIWQKSYTKAEQDASDGYASNQDGKNLYLMTKGTADKPGFDSQVNQYLTVIPADADWAQVEADLRKVLFTEMGNLPLTNINVQMLLYETSDVNIMQTIGGNTDIYPQNWAGYKTGQTNEPTTHTSMVFASPAPGSSKYVRIRMRYTESEGSTERYYYVEIRRAPLTVDADLNYGNSPYGMIMNDPAIADTNAAKEAFVENNYSFAGLTTGVPKVVTDNGLASLHYWLEAWAPPTEVWTAPNADWSTTNSVYDTDTGMSEALYNAVHTPGVNLDLNDYAFFAIMGEKFKDPGIRRATDSSGRPVDLTKAVLTLKAYTLDTTVNADAPADQLSRFALPSDPDELEKRTVTIGFLDADDGTEAVSGDTVKTDWAKWYLTSDGELTQENVEGSTQIELRPGRYQLTYTFPDYNYIKDDPDYGDKYLTVVRDFVVLAPTGDVNADLSVTTSKDKKGSDEDLVEQRVSPNAGYPALGYMAYPSDAIFKLRTCDANNDRNINDIDANAIGRGSQVKQFYLPVDYRS